MKLHRHIPNENDDITRHKWPQFVTNDVEQNDIYVMNEYICIRCRNSLQQKNKKCQIRHVQIVYNYMTSTRSTEYTALREKGDFSTNTNHNNITHEMIWWSLQSKWSSCQCPSNTRSNYRNIATHAK